MLIKGLKGDFQLYSDKDGAYPYAFSRDGRCVNIRTGKLRKPVLNRKYGYTYIVLHSGGKSKNEYIHRIIAKLYCPNPHGYVYVGHLDGDNSNNNANNLYWMSDREFHSLRTKKIKESYGKA